MTAGHVKESKSTSTLVRNSYGKSLVRLTKVMRASTPPKWKEITVETELFGDQFAGCYYDGDNSKVVATDSMKNTVYVEGAKHSLNSIEEFALVLAKHYLDDYSHVEEVRVSIEEDAWSHIEVNGKAHPTSFVKAGSENRLATVRMDRKKTDVQAGIEDLVVAKIADSEFAGYIKDKYTTLKETHDRIFGTKVNALWTFNNPEADFNSSYETARRVMLETFANHHSLSAQQTLFAMGDAVLNAVRDIEEVSIVLPNLHRVPFDLKPFGMDNRNEIFVNTSEPHGTIKGTIARKK